MDCSLPVPSVHGISQARILEWIAISFSRGSSWPRDQIRIQHWQVDSLPLSHHERTGSCSNSQIGFLNITLTFNSIQNLDYFQKSNKKPRTLFKFIASCFALFSFVSYLLRSSGLSPALSNILGQKHYSGYFAGCLQEKWKVMPASHGHREGAGKGRKAQWYILIKLGLILTPIIIFSFFFP